MKSILDWVAVGTTERADAHDPVVAQADGEIHKPFEETAILAQAACVDLHVTDWVTAQQEDPTLEAAIEWITGQKVQDLKHLLGDDTNTEEGKTRDPFTIATPLPADMKKFCDLWSPRLTR